MEEIIETTAETVENGELIEIVQLPVIRERLELIRDEIVAQTTEALAMDCTEDTYKQVKELRSALNKKYSELEERRKAVKKQVLEPYDAFEAIYKTYVTDVFKPAEKELADKINLVTDGIKAQKKQKAQMFFDEYTQAKNIDFLTFDNVGLVISMNISDKKCRETISAFVDKTIEDVAMIDTQEHADEILVEYKKCLSVSKAILVVKNRHDEIEAERARQAVLRAKAEQEALLAAKVDEAVAESVAEEVEQENLFSAPVEIENEVEETEPKNAMITEFSDDTLMQATFRVTETPLRKLRKLVNFMREEGIEFEQL